MDIRLLQNYALKLIEICEHKQSEDNRNATGTIVEDASDQPTPVVIITINDLLAYKLDVCK